MKKYLTVLGIAAILCLAALGCKEKQGPNVPNAAGASPAEIGAQALEAGEWAKALDAFGEAVEAAPDSADAYFGRAAAAVAIAENHYQLAKAAATNEEIEKGRAEAAKADEYFKIVKDDCAKALELDPKLADAHFLRGVAAQYQGEWEAGVEAFTQCVELSPEKAEAYHRRGEIYDHIGDYMNAQVDFKRAAELGYVDPKAPAEGEAPVENAEPAAETAE
ncbi:MAG: tetratricopeptide repeat protein [Thermoguttaceae bacterium]|nr:tetratricopeptide repeat protein [Thermoguttaceae bacterium]